MFPEARISAVLSSLAGSAGDRLTVADLLAALRERAFAILVVLLGLPNCLPMVFPIPTVCGLLLAFVAIQLAAGFRSPWLPRRVMTRSLPAEAVDRAVSRALPVLRRLERLSRPRFGFLESPVALRLIGLLLLAFALGLLVAAPFIGQIPLGIAVCLVGLGLVERDGVIILIGIAIGTVGLAANASFVYAIFAVLEHLVGGGETPALPNVHPGVIRQ